MNQTIKSSSLLLTLCVAGVISTASAQTPNPPLNLIGASVSPTQINLAWTNDETMAPYTDVRVERKQGSGGTWSEIAVLPGNPFVFVNGALASLTDYFYRVRAFSAGGFSAYSNMVSAATRSGSVQTQFASSVIEFSSQYSPGGFSAASMVGVPDVYPATADHGSAWSPATPDGQREFISLGFASPMQVSRIEVYETLEPGAIDTIYLRDASTGVWSIVYEGMASPTNGQARAFTVQIPLTPYMVDAVRLAVNAPAVPGWNEFDAVALSNPVPPSVNPSNPGAIFFDGANDRVRITDASTNFPPRTASAYAVTGTAITVEAWVYPMSVPAAGRNFNIISRPSAVFLENPFRTYGLLINTDTFDGIARFAFSLSDGTTLIGGGNDVTVESPLPVPVGVWTHVAGTYDGSYVRLYLNGELVRSFPFTGSIGAGSTGLYIGATGGDNFRGLIDEVRVWNSTRSTGEIQAASANVMTGGEASLVGYWPLNSDALPGAGWTPDLTANSNDLVVQNGARFLAFPFASDVSIAPTNISAGLSAVTGEAYASAVVSDGWPAATITPVSGPASMFLDGDTLRWIPTEAEYGSHPVILDATNVAGTVRDTITVYAELVHSVENDTRFDLTNRGKIGAFGQYGKGIVVNGKNGLYTADVSLVDRNANRFAGGLYTGAGSFAPVSGFAAVPSMAAGFTALETSFADAWEANRIGVRVTQTSYIKAGPPDHQFLVVDYRVVNESGAPLDDIFLQLTADFDVGVAGNNMAVYDTALGLVYAYETGGATNSAAYGIQVLSGSPSGMSVWNINDNLYVRSTANLTTFSAPLTTSGDVRGQFSVGPFSAAALDSFSVTVAYLGAPSVDELRFAAARARQVVQDPATIVDLPVVNETEPNGSLLEANSVAFESNLVGEISTGSDVDYYQFTVPVAGYVQIIGQQGEASGLKYRFELYNSIGNIEYSSWWYIPTDVMPYGYVYLNPGTYTLRVLQSYNPSSYPYKTALPKGSKVAELEQKARQLNREARVMAPDDTSGTYQITLRTFQPVLGRPGYLWIDIMSDNSVIVSEQFVTGEENTELYVDYGETTAYGNTIYLGTYGVQLVYRSDVLNGLQPGRGYHLRYRLVGNLGTAFSRDIPFETPVASPTWARQNLPDASTNYLYSVDAVDERTLYATGGDVFRTTNGGLTWQALGARYLYYHYPYESVFWSGSNGVTVGEGMDVIIATSDSGKTWTSRLTMPSYSVLYKVSTYDGSTIVAAGSQGMVARSTDSGVTWQVGTLPTITNVSAMTFAGPSVVLIADYDGNILRSTDGGASWTLTQTLGDGVISMASVNATTVYAGAYNWVWKSTDGGASWSSITSSPRYCYGMKMVDGNNGYAVSYSGRVFSTSDGWQTYQVTPTGSGNSLYAVDASGRGVTVVGAVGTIRRLGPVFEEEPNNEATTSFEVSYNAEVEAVLNPDGDVDYYKFSGGIGDTVEISTLVPPTSDLYQYLGTVIQLFDPLGTRISFSDWFVVEPALGVTDRMVRILPATGTYYVRISDPRYSSGVFPFKTLDPNKSPDEYLPSPAKAKVLSPNSAYTFRLRRKSAGVPNVVSAGFQGLFSDRVYIRANILPNGGNTTGGVQYGTTPALGSFAPFEGTPATGVSAVILRALLSGLSPETKYYYRPSVTNEFGTFAPDSINEITTPPAPNGWEYRPTGTEVTLVDVAFVPGQGFGMTVGVGGNIRRSYDYGLSWDSVAAFSATTLYAVHTPYYQVAVVAGFANVLRRTTDGGQSWYVPASPYPTTGPSWYSMSFMDRSNGIVGGTSGAVMRTSDAGETWTNVSPIPGTAFARTIQMVNGSIFVAGMSSGSVAISIDGGMTWTLSPVYVAPKFADAVAFFGQLNGYVGSSSDSLAYRTTDGGSSWTPVYFPVLAGSGLRHGTVGPDGVGYLSATNGTVLISTDAGATWTPTATGFGSSLIGLQSSEPGVAFGAGPFGAVFIRDTRPSSVTMYVDMRSAIQSGLFNSSIDTLTLRGGTLPLQWSGFNHMMTDDVGSGIDSIYQVSFVIPDPGQLEYKFVIRHRSTDLWERAATTTGNRVTVLPRGYSGYGHTFDDRPDQFVLEVGQYAPAPNVIGLWHLDEDTLQHVIWGSGGPLIVDNSARSVHGYSTGTTMVPGRHGLARFFSGVDNSGIRLEQGFFYPSPLPYSFTTELWVNLGQYPSMNSAAVFSGGKYEAVIGITTSGRLQIGIRGVAMTLDSSVAAIELNRWVHLAMQYDASSNTMRGYIDGQLAVESFLGALFSPGSTLSQAFIGGGPGFGQFRGTIDEVRVSDRLVDPTEFKLVLRPRFAQAISSDRRVWLTWQSALGGLPVAVYRIYRGADSTNVTLLDSVQATSGQYVDTTAVNGAIYFYRVAAVDVSGFKGRSTAALRGTPLPIPAITATTPTRNTLQAPAVTNIILQFNTDLDSTSVQPQDVRVVGGLSGPMNPNLVRYLPALRQLEFQPETSFTRGEEVEVSVRPGLRNINGDSLASPMVARFRVASTGGTGVMAGANVNSSGASPAVVAAGDIDNDGDIDVVSANSSGDNLSVYRNSGRGDLVPTNTLPQAGSPFGVVLTDVHGDGWLDLAVTTMSTGTVVVWQNTGGGNFSSPQTYAVGSSPHGIAAGDLNGDGFTDLVVTNAGSLSFSVMTNNGTGGFNVTTYGSAGNGPAGVALADLNRDGKLDVALTASVDGTARWYRNTGSGFVYELGLALGGGAYAIATADINGDGNNDIITGLSVTTNNLRIDRLNNSGGLLGTSLFTVGSDIRGLGVGDFTGDGVVDIVVADHGQNRIRVLANNGSGSFAETSFNDVGTNPWRLVTGDFDGDGDLDIVAGHQNSAFVTILRNNVDNTAPVQVANPKISESSHRVTLAWTANAETDIARYVIFRSLSPSPTPARLDSVGPTVTSYTDFSVTDSIVYFYYVKAVDAAGNESPQSFARAATPHARLAGEYASTDTNTVLLLPFAEADGQAYNIDASRNGQSGMAFGGHSSTVGRFGRGKSVSGAKWTRFNHRTYLAPTGSFTVEAWVRPGVVGPGTIVRKDTTGSSGYALSLSAAGLPTFEVYQPSAVVQGPAALAAGEWTHVAGIYTGTQLLLYVNGILAASSAASGPLTIGAEFLGIGALATAAPSGFFTGGLDEVRLSVVARTPAEFNLQLPPRSLSASAAGATINLSWQTGGGASPLARYRIYRGADSTSMTLVDSTTATSYSNSDLQLATQYFYRVTAVDAAEYESPRSNAAFATTSSAPSVATVTTFAGGTQGSADGTGAAAQFSFPEGVAIDVLGNIYVADGGNGAIRKIAPNRAVTTLATGLGTVAGVAVDSLGNIFAASVSQHKIYRITPAGVKTVYAGSGAPGSADGDSTAAEFNGPSGLAFDRQGNLYVADRDNNMIRRISPARFVAILAGNASGIAGFSNSGSTSRFDAPSDVSFDALGNLYVADRDNNAIRKVVFGSGSSVTVSTLAGLGPASAGSADGNSTVATFNLPTGVTVDNSGNVFVGDRDNSTLRRISTAGIVSTIAGAALQTGIVDDTASAARFYQTRDVVSDPTSTLYVADWGNHAIRRVITNYVPSVFTTEATGVTATAATMTGYVNPNALATDAYFEYGTTSDYGTSTTPASVGAGASFIARSANLTGLVPNTVYHYRLVASNESGTTFGSHRTFTTALAAPGLPKLSAPDSAVAGVSVTPTLTWLAGANAETYRLQLSFASDFSTVADDDSTLTGLSHSEGPLSHDTVYYWRVRSQNVTGTSAYTTPWFFRTIVDTPDVPVLTTPGDGATDQPVALTLNWNAAARTTTYHVQVSASNTFAVLSFEDSTLTGTSAAVNGMANLTTYYWRVRAKNAGGTSAYSSTRQFTTIIAAPGDPTLVSPADSAANQPTTLTLVWNAAARASTYRLQVSGDAAFTSLVLDDSTLGATSRSVGPLENDRTYYWRVKAKNAGGTTAFTAARMFRTIISVPDVPVLVSPDSAAGNVPVTLTASWREASRAEWYHVQLSTSSGFGTTLINDSTLTDTSRAFSGLSNDVQYYWRVRSMNAGGSSAYSSIWTFRTVVSAPEVPVLAAPLDSVVDQPVTLPFSWSAAARATSYRLEVSTDSLFQTLAFVDTAITGTTRGVGPLGYSTQHYWRVRAQNVGGNSAFSIRRTFRTIIEPPLAPIQVGPDTLSTLIPTTAQLAWRAAPRAASYRVQVALFSNFGVNVTDQSGLTDTTLSVGPLFNDTTYYWRVSATNAGGTSSFSSVWRFRTIVAAPDVPSLAAPGVGSVNQPIVMDFSWSSANRATSYRLEVSEQSNFSALYFVDSTITGTSRQVTLTFNTTYYWRVRGQNVGGAGGFSAARSFTTIIQAPAVPALFEPDSGATSLPVTVNLRWWSAPRAASYTVHVSQNPNFSTFVTNQPGLTDTVLSVGPLSNAVEYYWRVNASNAGGTSAYSQTRSFQTVVAAPDIPTLVTPSDNATNLSPSVSFAWSSSARAATYRLQVSMDPGFTSGVQDIGGLTGTTHGITGLAYDAQYYWRVRAENAGGVSGYTTPRQFHTVVAPPTAAPTLANPADNAMSVLPNASFTWNAVSGATLYHFQLSTASDFTGNTYNDSTLATTSVSPPGLTYDTQYFWRVRAKNAGGSGPWSASRTLRTALNAPLASLTPSPVDFGTVEAGLESTDRDLTLSNNGGLNLNVTSVTLNGTDPSSFSILSGGGSFSLAAGGTRQITIRFAPQSRGTKSARLVLQTNDTRFPSGLADTLTGFAADNTPPYDPALAVSVTPSGWTNRTPISITWTPDISDVSGVPSVWVSPSVAPTTGQPGTPIALSGSSFIVPSPVTRGAVPVYFYFEDGAGNKNPTLSYQVLVRFDDIAPTITHDTSAVPEVTVQSGTASPPVVIAAAASDLHVGASGIKSFTLEYRSVVDPSYTSASMLSGSFTIPAAKFVQNNGPIGVDYRLVTLDSADNRTATKVYSIRVKTVEAPPPQPTPLVSVAALPPGTDLVKAYRLFSVPYNLDDKRPSSIFPLATNLGPHDQDGVPYANWRLQRYVSGLKQDYETFKDQNAITPGTAFFLIVKNSEKRITVGTGSIVNAQEMNDVGIPLQTGWNLIGNPLLRDIAVDSLKVTAGGTIDQRAVYTGSGTQSGWDMDPTVLKQWEGVAIKVLGPTNLLFRTIGSQPGLADPDMPVGRLRAAEAMADQEVSRNWLIEFGAYRTDNDMVDLGDAIGMVSGAQEGRDRYDHYQPPFVGTRNVALYFQNGDEAMTQDIRPNNEQGGVWEMKVVTGDRGARVRLVTLGADHVPEPGFEAFLIDLDQRMAYNLRSTTEIFINTLEGRRNFRVVVGRKEFLAANDGGVDLYPQQFQLFANYPNPFNPETIIRYTVADRPGRLLVSLKVYDMLGREVAALVDREQGAGYYEIPFRGASLSSGPYFYRLQVTEENGNALYARVMKMVLVK